MQNRSVYFLWFTALWISISGLLVAHDLYTFRMDLSTTQGNGIGYKKGYSTLAAFVMPATYQCKSLYPFLDVRAHGFNNLKLALNAGLGIRYLTPSIWIVGANAYYDNRQGSHRGFSQVGNPFQQVGVGFEALSPFLDFRLNIYLPVGKKVWKFRQITYNDGQGILPIIHKKQQSTMKGINLEMGGTVGRWNICECLDWSSYLAGGPYYLDQEKGSGRWGGQLRLTSIFARYYLFELRGSYDHVTKGTFQVKAGVEFPLFPKTSIKGKRDCVEPCYQNSIWASLREMLSQPVMRSEIIPLKSSSR